MTKTHRKGDTSYKGAKAATERMCIVSRKVKSNSELLRFVLDPDQNVVADLKNILPGRGVWVSAEKVSVDMARTKGLFARNFKSRVNVDPKLAEKVEQLLEKQAKQSLSLTAKAGLVITGFEKVQTCLGSRDLRGLLFASDGAKDGILKILSKLKKNAHPDDVAVHQSLRCEEISLALGRVNVIHAAVLKGGTSALFLTHLERLDRFRGSSADEMVSNQRG